VEDFDYIVYTDGCSLGNPGAGGVGIVIIDKDKQEKRFCKGFTRATNNQMELMAVILALKELPNNCKVSVFTDSEYVANALNQGWLERWKSNGWKTAAKKPVKNKELWEALDRELSQKKVVFNWVKGHSSDHYNNLAHTLANSAALKSENQI